MKILPTDIYHSELSDRRFVEGILFRISGFLGDPHDYHWVIAHTPNEAWKAVYGNLDFYDADRIEYVSSAVFASDSPL